MKCPKAWAFSDKCFLKSSTARAWGITEDGGKIGKGVWQRPELWVNLQSQYDLWYAKQNVGGEKIRFFLRATQCDTTYRISPRKVKLQPLQALKNSYWLLPLRSMYVSSPSLSRSRYTFIAAVSTTAVVSLYNI